MGKKRKKKQKRRNPYALPAMMRSGAGVHKDKKKEKRKRACRDWRY